MPFYAEPGIPELHWSTTETEKAFSAQTGLVIHFIPAIYVTGMIPFHKIKTSGPD